MQYYVAILIYKFCKCNVSTVLRFLGMLKVLRLYSTQVSAVPIGMNTARTPVSSPHTGPMVRGNVPVATSTSSSGLDIECDTKPLPVIATLMYAIGVGMLLYALFGDSPKSDGSSCTSCGESSPSVIEPSRRSSVDLDDIGSHVNRALEPYVVLHEKTNRALETIMRELRVVKTRVDEFKPMVSDSKHESLPMSDKAAVATLPAVEWD